MIFCAKMLQHAKMPTPPFSESMRASDLLLPWDEIPVLTGDGDVYGRVRAASHVHGNSKTMLCALSTGAGGGGVALPEVEQEEEVVSDAPWNVVVHNDPVNLMSYVTKVFQKIFGFSVEQAEKHMLEVHHKGRSVVWSGSREKAEFYVQQLHGYLLLSTLEKSV